MSRVLTRLLEVEEIPAGPGIAPGSLINRLRDEREQEKAARPIPMDPKQASAAALSDYAQGRLAKLPELPSRELLHSELLLLQQAYIRLLRRSTPSQRRPVQLAHERAYERLEGLLDDIAPPLTTKPPRRSSHRDTAPNAFGIEVVSSED